MFELFALIESSYKNITAWNTKSTTLKIKIKCHGISISPDKMQSITLQQKLLSLGDM